MLLKKYSNQRLQKSPKGVCIVLEPEEILRNNPGSAIFSRYAEQLAREGRVEEAVDILKKGIQANPYYAPGYSVLAEILFQLQSEEEAVDHLLSSVRLDPQMPRDLFRLGSYYQDNEREKGEAFLQTAREYEPNISDSILEEARFRPVVSESRPETPASIPDDAAAKGEENEEYLEFLDVNEEEKTIPEDTQELEDFISIFHEDSDFNGQITGNGDIPATDEFTATEFEQESASDENSATGEPVINDTNLEPQLTAPEDATAGETALETDEGVESQQQPSGFPEPTGEDIPFLSEEERR